MSYMPIQKPSDGKYLWFEDCDLKGFQSTDLHLELVYPQSKWRTSTSSLWVYGILHSNRDQRIQSNRLSASPKQIPHSLLCSNGQVGEEEATIPSKIFTTPLSEIMERLEVVQISF